MADKPSISTRWKNIQPTKKFVFWACVASIALTVLVGFKWGGWVTGSTAQLMADNGAADARTELAIASCIVRFGEGADVGVRLAKLKKTDSWMRGTYMEKAGWATPTGAEGPVQDAGERCAEQLLNPKMATPAS
jgi:hypothetical protein